MRVVIAWMMLAMPLMAQHMNELPYFGSWNTGEFQLADGQDTGYHPDWQLEQMAQGRHIYPTFEIITDTLPTNIRANRAAYYEPMWTHAKAEGLPLVLIGRNYEGMFGKLQPWTDMTTGQDHPFLELADGTIVEKASPWNQHVHHWYDLGLRFGQWLEAEYASDYPDVPWVYLGNNNEAGIAKYHEAVNDIAKPTYLEGVNKFIVTREMWQGYRLRRMRFIQGLNDGCPSWAGKMKIYAYSGFGNEFGAVEGQPDSWGRYRFPWVGADGDTEYIGYSVTANIGYLHSWSNHSPHKVRSPQVEACNAKYAMDLYKAAHPDFEVETHFWNGQNVSAEVWQGVIRCVMWIMRTKHNRLFLGASRTVADTYARDMHPLVTACEEVHNIPTLTRFWKHGKLLKNLWERDPAQQPPTQWEAKDLSKRFVKGYGHPFHWPNAMPAESKDPGERWFLQHAELNERVRFVPHQTSPQFDQYRDWWQSDRTHQQVVKVYCLAFEEGGEYLLYAHSPIGEQTNVVVQVCPDGSSPRFTVELPTVPVSGSFWLYDTEGQLSAVTE